MHGERLADGPLGRTRAAGMDEHAMGRRSGAAVERSAHRAEPGQHDVIGVRAGGRGDPRRQRRAGQLVVGQQHERGVERADARRVGTDPGQLGPEAGGEAGTAGLGSLGPAVGEPVDQRRQQRPGVMGHRLGAEVDPQRPRRRHGRGRHPDAIGGRHRLPERSGDGPGQRDVALRRIPASPLGQPSGPEQLGDVLERARRHQADGVVTPVAQRAVADLGEGGRQDDVDDARAPDVAAGATAPGQLVHFGGVEPAGSPVVADLAVEQAATDVGVDGGGLDAQPLGDLSGREPC